MQPIRLFGWTIIAICVAVAPAGAQTYTESVVYSFCSQANCTDGGGPPFGVIVGADGDLYGTTVYGGTDTARSLGSGTAYKLTPTGSESVLYDFCSLTNCADGQSPQGALTQSPNGDFYGVTTGGGSGAYGTDGTVFQLTSTGVLTTLYSFCSLHYCADGLTPNGSLVQDSDGNLYGTTYSGGASSTSTQTGVGTIFKIDSSGAFTTLYSFCGLGTPPNDCVDGAYPQTGLALGPDGSYYGTTGGGGSNGEGTVFSITPSGTLSTIYNFCNLSGCTDGAGPTGGLVLGNDGNFYGITGEGGVYGKLTGIPDGGTVFKITAQGELTTLYNFCAVANCADGSEPIYPLLQANDGNFYGATYEGGTAGLGTVFKITPSGVFTSIHTFCATSTSCPDGEGPISSLVQAANGTMYGAAYNGGTANRGVVYAIAGLPGAPPAVSIELNAIPTPLSVGQAVDLAITVFGIGSAPTGTVTLNAGSLTICKGTLSGGETSCAIATTSSLAPGTYPITVNYSGDSNYNSASRTINLTLNPAPVNITLATSSTSITPPTSVSLTATVQRSATGATGTPTGNVSFYAGTTLLGTATLSNGQAKLTEAVPDSIPGGTYAITAKYHGDSSDLTATSNTVNVNVLAATQTSVTVSPNPIPASSAFSVTVQVKQKYDSVVPVGTVTVTAGSYSLGDGSLNSAGQVVVNASALGIPAGTYAVTAAYGGSSANAASNATVNVTVQ